jgi:fructoselysine-6-P-deglycase FrlB-like protein
MSFQDTGLWADVRELPGALEATLAASEGVTAAADVLRSDGVRRVVATGNGAAYYVAHALWLASLECTEPGPPIVALPCGVVAHERFRWQPGDAVLAVSSSGEFREVVEVVRRSGDRPTVAITAQAESALAAAATVTVLQHVESQRAVTHTQALSGAYACGLALWAELTGDAGLRTCLVTATAEAARAVAEAEEWAAEHAGGLAPPAAAVVVGGGAAWAAALELALMLKEISRVPAEGVETREGATSAMFGLAPGHLMASFDPPGDPLGDEALRLCAATGATTLRMPGVTTADTRLAPITTIPGAAALSAALAQARGHDVDQPGWTDAYYETARSAT